MVSSPVSVRPGANLTGISRFAIDLLPKRVELLRDVVPKAIVIGFMVNPASSFAESDVRQVLAAAGALGAARRGDQGQDRR